jgi:hypothetical protein
MDQRQYPGRARSGAVLRQPPRAAVRLSHLRDEVFCNISALTAPAYSCGANCRGRSQEICCEPISH